MVRRRTPENPVRWMARAGQGAAARTEFVHERLPQVRLQRTLVAVLEAVDPLERLQQCFLDEILRVARIPRPAWEPSAGPAAERDEIPRKKRLERRFVAGTDSLE